MTKNWLRRAIMMSPFLLSACGTMNSDFSCKKTAQDNCLSIEEVDSRTRFADNPGDHAVAELERYIRLHETNHA